jgi:hypothetical protein
MAAGPGSCEDACSAIVIEEDLPMNQTWIAVAGAVALAGTIVAAQSGQPKPLSPDGIASAQVLGKYTKPAGRGAPALGGENYEGGKWIEILYGRPLKRGRDLWGSGATYGRASLVGAPIWRAGANVTTRLRTEVPLVIGGKPVPAGEYTMFVDLKENNWTLVISRFGALPQFDPTNANKDALWGAYNYTPDKDVVRVQMKLETLPHSTEELTWEFLDMTGTSGAMAIRWDKTMASVPFTVAG